MIVRSSCFRSKLCVDEVLRQGVEQLRIAGRVGRAQVVERLDQAAAHVSSPRSG